MNRVKAYRVKAYYVLLIVLLAVLFGVDNIYAQTAPTVNGLFYGDGDYNNYYYLMRGTNGRGDVYYNLVGDTLYLLMLVDESVNDNVFGTKKDDKSYMESAGWSAVHTGQRLIGSDHLEMALICGGTTWSWWQDYVYDANGNSDPDETDWLSDPWGPDGGGTPPPGLIAAASSMQWNMNNSAWDVTLGGTRSDYNSWKSGDGDGDNDVTDEGWPTWNDTYQWEWAMVYEMSIDLSACGSNPLSVEIISSHNSPAKDGDQDLPIPIVELMDYGDAPDGYGTTLGANGARHYVVINGPFLGANVDADSNGQPNANALGDDMLDGTDDENGVVFSTSLVPCQQGNITVTASAAGELDAWIDFNADGDWADPGEQVFASQQLVAGSNALSFTVPCGATLTAQTFARFRFSTAGGLSYAGFADDGEVEDYEVAIIQEDSDGDGVPDGDDNCVNTPNPGQEDGDGDGVGDVCDNCPTDPDKTEPGICGCGVADTDSDGDGTPDCNDNCPADPDKTDPGVCGCGVADTDSDGDGVADCLDICPGFDDSQDADVDGMPDGCDSCPADPQNDADGDDICGDVDNCPFTSNPDQTDSDLDGMGDACDSEGEPDIHLSETYHDFGSVTIGTCTSWTFQVANIGNATLTVIPVNQGCQSYTITSPSFPLHLEPSDYADVTIEFCPVSEVVYSCGFMLSSNDPDEPTQSVTTIGQGVAAHNPDIEVSPLNYNFGYVTINNSAYFEISVCNLGTAMLIVADRDVSNEVFNVSSPALPWNMNPSECVVVTVSFTPSSTGYQSGFMTINSDDPDEGIVTVNLSGYGTLGSVPDIDISFEEYDFEDVHVGSCENVVLSISNSGTAALDVSSIVSNCSDFDVQTPVVPLLIPPFGCGTIEVTFCPSDLRFESCIITIWSDDPDEEVVTATVEGTGVESEPAVLSLSNCCGEPGGLVGAQLDLSSNGKTICHVHTELLYNPTIVNVGEVAPSPRSAEMSSFQWSRPQDGQLVIRVSDGNGKSLPKGEGPIAEISLIMTTSATGGDQSSLQFLSAELKDPSGSVLPIDTKNGTAAISSSGDLNLDESVDILDAVIIVNIILETHQPQSFELCAADCNSDGNIDILDVTYLISDILGQGGTGAKMGSTPSLIEAGLAQRSEGNSFTVPIEYSSAIPLSGIQMKIEFESHVDIRSIRNIGRGEKMTLAGAFGRSGATILLFSPDGEFISAGTGPIVTLEFHAHENMRGEEQLHITKTLAVSVDGISLPVDVGQKESKLIGRPKKFSLSQNYPNPFNPETNIVFTVPREEWITVNVFNILGQEVITLIDEQKDVGSYTICWDGTDRFGRRLSSGIYIAQFRAGTHVQSRRMTLVR